MTRRLVTPEDLCQLRYIHSPRITRKGNKIVFVQTEVGNGCNSYKSGIYKMDINDRYPEFISSGILPAWSSDDKRLAFLDDDQIWVIKDNGKREKITHFEGNIKDFKWSPSGSQILAVVETTVSASGGPDNDNLYHITDLKYKQDGRGYIYNKQSQLFLVDVDNKQTRQLTTTSYGVESPVWSPDGERFAYITADSDPAGTWERKIVCANSVGDSITTICYAIGAQNLSWSPDGGYLAFRAAAREYDPSVNFGLWLASLDGNEVYELTEEMDIFVGNDRTLSDTSFGAVTQGGVWSGDSSKIYFIAAERGRNLLYEITVANRKAKCLTVESEAKVVFNFSYSAEKDLIIAAAGNFENPGDLWLLPEDKKITDINRDLLKEIEIAIPEKIEWANDDDTFIEGWILKPPYFEEEKKYPAILEIHGGPYRQYGMTYFHEMQVLAAAGYAILFSNPRGSQGYGQKFAHSIHGDWGNKDYADLLTGVEILNSLGYIDQERLGVTGGSYGGYMTNWIVSQTDKFRAAVTDRSVSNLYSFMGTSDIAISFGESDFGNIWDDKQLEKMLERSPLKYVDRINTPLLIIHQLEDSCCPVEQAEQLYVALKRLGAETEMVLFPGACHELSRSGSPVQRVQRLKWIKYWFDRYL